MCITHHFYHLCGHTHHTATPQCTFSHSASSSSSYRKAGCPVLTPPAEVHLFPTLCAKCESVSVISDWLKFTPGGRFDVIRAWNLANRRQERGKVDLKSEIANLERFDDDDKAKPDEDALEGQITDLERFDEEETESDVKTAVDSDETVIGDALSAEESKRSNAKPRHNAQAVDVVALKARITAMTTKVRARIQELSDRDKRA